MSASQVLPELEGEAIAARALDGRIGRVGAYLAAGADVFFFLAWFFAFFYLRALDNNHAWLAGGVTRPSVGIGTATAVLAIAAALSFFGGTRASSPGELRTLYAAALVFGVAAAATGFYQLWHLGFGMPDGGYPSVFTGLMGSWLVQFTVALAWLATILVQARAAGDTLVRRDAAASFGYLLYFLAAIQILAYAALYYI